MASHRCWESPPEALSEPPPADRLTTSECVPWKQRFHHLGALAAPLPPLGLSFLPPGWGSDPWLQVHTVKQPIPRELSQENPLLPHKPCFPSSKPGTLPPKGDGAWIPQMCGHGAACLFRVPMTLLIVFWPQKLSQCPYWIHMEDLSTPWHLGIVPTFGLLPSHINLPFSVSVYSLPSVFYHPASVYLSIMYLISNVLFIARNFYKIYHFHFSRMTSVTMNADNLEANRSASCCHDLLPCVHSQSMFYQWHFVQLDSGHQKRKSSHNF